MSSYGPKGNHPFIASPVLNKLYDEDTEYVSSLPLWKRFIVWRYTIGSATLTRYLVGLDTPNAVGWAYELFALWNYSNKRIGPKFKRFERFFAYPDSLITDPDRDEIAKKVVELYVAELQSIILHAPQTTGTIKVYKVVTRYPDLPPAGKFKRMQLVNKPFGSTTVSPNDDLGAFVSDVDDSVFMVITIPKGARVLYVPFEYHAYTWEHEIILPHGATFSLQSTEEIRLDYIKKGDLPIVSVQEAPVSMGPLYEVEFKERIRLSRKRVIAYHVKYGFRK